MTGWAAEAAMGAAEQSGSATTVGILCPRVEATTSGEASVTLVISETAVGTTIDGMTGGAAGGMTGGVTGGMTSRMAGGMAGGTAGNIADRMTDGTTGGTTSKIAGGVTGGTTGGMIGGEMTGRLVDGAIEGKRGAKGLPIDVTVDRKVRGANGVSGANGANGATAKAIGGMIEPTDQTIELRGRTTDEMIRKGRSGAARGN